MVRTGVARLYTYFGGYWFITQEDDRISVYNDDDRTNNFAEAFNRWFNARCVIPPKKIFGTLHLLSVSDNILSKFLSNILVLYINSYSITLLAHL